MGFSLITAQGGKVLAYDPEANEEARHIYANRQDVNIVDDREATLDQVDALFVVTEWNEFRSPDFTALKAQMKNPVLLDGRNLYDPNFLKELGFAYYAIGRGQSA